MGAASDLDVAVGLADAARRAALAHFRATDLRIENKRASSGDFDPVTVADREVENAIRAILAFERPDDGILGEEQSAVTGTSGRTWVIDPIDGTRAFMAGLPTWGVLIALNDGVKPILGVMDQPFTGERYIGVTGPEPIAILKRGGASTDLRTRACYGLSSAVLCSTAPDAFASGADFERFSDLSSQVKLTRYGTDCYGYAMVALGQIDMVVESGLNPYDIQAMIPIIEAAGGIVTDWNGGDCQHGGQVIAAGDRRLHEQAVSILSQ